MQEATHFRENKLGRNSTNPVGTTYVALKSVDPQPSELLVTPAYPNSLREYAHKQK